jgi:alpha-beta hydrolase superfamily lysophospholipase
MTIFDRAEFNRALFFPRPDASVAPDGAIDLFVPVGGARVHVRLHDSAASCVVLLFHGNGEVVADYDEAAGAFARAGAALAVADYRGYGQSDGEPTLRHVIADARPVAETIAARAARGRPVVVMGRSLGGAAAHELYASPIAGLAAVVLESAFFELHGLVRRRGLIPPPAFTADELAVFDPATKLSRGRLPLLLLHGAGDELVAHREAEAAFAAAGSADKQLVTIAGHGHNDVSAAAAYWSALGTFLGRVSQRSP